MRWTCAMALLMLAAIAILFWIFPDYNPHHNPLG